MIQAVMRTRKVKPNARMWLLISPELTGASAISPIAPNREGEPEDEVRERLDARTRTPVAQRRLHAPPWTNTAVGSFSKLATTDRGTRQPLLEDRAPRPRSG